MPEGRKIATCCYCGTRSVLVFDRGRHTLGCAACGAPLRDMKLMPKAAEKKKKKGAATAGATFPIPTCPKEVRRDRQSDHSRHWQPAHRKPRKKKRKPLMRRMLEELWDEVEDVFD